MAEALGLDKDEVVAAVQGGKKDRPKETGTKTKSTERKRENRRQGAKEHMRGQAVTWTWLRPSTSTKWSHPAMMTRRGSDPSSPCPA
eukprot:1901003-Rhodomonas_salina.3